MSKYYDPNTVGRCKYCKKDILADGTGTYVKSYGSVHMKCERKRNRELKKRRKKK